VVPYRHAVRVSRGEPQRHRRRPRRTVGPSALPLTSATMARAAIPEAPPVVAGLAYAVPLAVALWTLIGALVTIIA
jgi:hypothetical protein